MKLSSSCLSRHSATFSSQVVADRLLLLELFLANPTEIASTFRAVDTIGLAAFLDKIPTIRATFITLLQHLLILLYHLPLLAAIYGVAIVASQTLLSPADIAFQLHCPLDLLPLKEVLTALTGYI